jgi:threonine synthase
LLDPHGACGYQALLDRRLAADRTGLFLETAHPAKFKETVDYITGASTEIPAALASFMDGEKQSVEIDNSYASFRDYLYEI